uniref:HVA22-like protein n=1 Tax=Ananas comosus var. bracteatus TaxID=296719 RepID=A0A6V7QW77_ANACO
MMGSFLSRALLLAFGYAYPAYQCYKTVELNKPEIQQLIFWCQYWILVALLTVLERFTDAFVSWLPMYNEAKLAFFIYLWYPKTMGTTYIYETFFRPYISQHENDIDRNLLELRARACDVVVLYWQKATSYGQTTFFDVLQYVALQSSSLTSRSGSAQQKEQQYRRAVSLPSSQPPAPASQPAEEPTTTTASNPRLIRRLEPFKAKPITHPAQPQEPAAAADPPADPAAEPPTSKSVSDLPSIEATTTSQPIDEAEADEEMPVDEEAEAEGKEDGKSPETPIEETVRMTRYRLRKRVATTAIPSAGN